MIDGKCVEIPCRKRGSKKNHLRISMVRIKVISQISKDFFFFERMLRKMKKFLCRCLYAGDSLC